MRDRNGTPLEPGDRVRWPMDDPERVRELEVIGKAPIGDIVVSMPFTDVFGGPRVYPDHPEITATIDQLLATEAEVGARPGCVAVAVRSERVERVERT
jgi:hypothetical protein